MIDQGIRRFSSLVVSLCREEQTVSARGLLQLLDARVKILFLALFVIIVSLKQDIFGEAVIALGLLVLAVSSRIPLGRFYSRIAGFAFFFGFLIAVPATLNLIVPGDVVLPLVTLERAHDFWVYHIPREIGLTAQGIHAAAMLCLRVMNSLTISLLVLYTTPVAQIVGALKVFPDPGGLCAHHNPFGKIHCRLFPEYRRDVSGAEGAAQRRRKRGQAARMWIAGRIVYLFRRTERRYEQIYRAMTARGYTHDYRPPPFAVFAAADCLAIAAMVIAGAAILIL